jgi:hypothetical protein
MIDWSAGFFELQTSGTDVPRLGSQHLPHAERSAGT